MSTSHEGSAATRRFRRRLAMALWRVGLRGLSWRVYTFSEEVFDGLI